MQGKERKPGRGHVFKLYQVFLGGDDHFGSLGERLDVLPVSRFIFIVVREIESGYHPRSKRIEHRTEAAGIGNAADRGDASTFNRQGHLPPGALIRRCQGRWFQSRPKSELVASYLALDRVRAAQPPSMDEDDGIGALKGRSRFAQWTCGQ